MLPDPVQPQYLTGTLGPLIVPAVALGLATWQRRFRKIGAPAVLVLAVPLAGIALLVRADGVNAGDEWTWRSYREVCALIEEHTAPDDIVASFWPGYVFETGRRYLPGMENHFAIGVSEELTGAEKQRYHIIGKESLMGMFAISRPRAVVLGIWMNEINTALDDEEMTAVIDVFLDHYCLAGKVGQVKLAVACPQGASGTLGTLSGFP